MEKAVNSEITMQTTQENEQKFTQPRATKAVLTLLAHLVFCLALAFAIAFGVDGYKAIDADASRHYRGRYLLRVADVTTLISASLVVIKLTVTSWSVIAFWRCGSLLINHTETGLNPRRISFMMTWRLPPWFMWRFKYPKDKIGWATATVLLLVFPQAFIAPLLSGAINWKTSSAPGSEVPVASANPNADFGLWYWYLAQGTSRKSALRQAAGAVTHAWADTTQVNNDGTDRSGNGCRHIVNDDGLAVNSTLHNAIIPCIKIHDIVWFKSTPSDAITALIGPSDSDKLSLVDDTPYFYYTSGAAVVFDPLAPKWDSDKLVIPYSRTAEHPSPYLFSGTKTIGLLVARQDVTTPACSPIGPGAFGDTSHLDYVWSTGNSAQQNCYLVGNITFTAGVVKSEASKYISSTVIEGQGEPLDFQPDIWVREALWQLPDLMTMIAVMNSTSLPTWNNIDNYVEMLVRYSYLGAWDSLHAAFDKNNIHLTATTVVPRLQATVSFSRVFSWLGISVLMTLSGILLMQVQKRYPYYPSHADTGAKTEGTQEGQKEMLDQMMLL